MKVRIFNDGSAQVLPEPGDGEFTEGVPSTFPKHPDGGKVLSTAKDLAGRDWCLSADEQVKRGIATADGVARAKKIARG